MYPNSALAAWQLVVLAVVVLASLGIWLTAAAPAASPAPIAWLRV